ncbi:hypothetical protein C8F01DRAFT_1318541 [Mycena amicta]|nr:hypothetical protein C8F01DRAFT_1318541 [Mycena amicta]
MFPLFHRHNTLVLLFLLTTGTVFVSGRPATATQATQAPPPASTGTGLTDPETASSTSTLLTIAGHLYICTDENFAGVCTKFGFYDSVCQTFPPGFANQISSAVADPGWQCGLSSSTDCSGGFFVSNPGSASMQGFDNQAVAVQCLLTCQLDNTCVGGR